MITTLATFKNFLLKKNTGGEGIGALHFNDKSNNILSTDWWNLF
jgi:hypothetical protein